MAAADQPRPSAKAAVTQLKQLGLEVAMISGDRQPVVTRVAASIGCEEAKGDCLPQNKVEYVRAMKAKGYKVAVVGDGVNDAPALAAGDIGIAMGAAGSEVAIHSATIALMNNDLRRLPFRGSRPPASRRALPSGPRFRPFPSAALLKPACPSYNLAFARRRSHG